MGIRGDIGDGGFVIEAGLLQSPFYIPSELVV
jgi:hypothetical protein